MPSKPWPKRRTLWPCVVLCCIAFIHTCNSLQVEGIWNPYSSPLKVIARFGIGQSRPNHEEESSGYAFGNFTFLSSNLIAGHLPGKTRQDDLHNNAVLLYVNRTMFKQIYQIHTQLHAEEASHHNTTIQQHRSTFCERVYHLIEDQFYDAKCSRENKTNLFDFVRYVPCPKDKSCNDPSQVKALPNYQFTFIIDNKKEPTFWFLLLLSCQRKINQNIHTNSSNANKCTWTSSVDTKSLLSYDIWLVNGHPSSAAHKLIDLGHQFSLEQQSLFMYLGLDLCYLLLLFMQLYILSRHKIRSLNYLFTISLSLNCLAYFFICCHQIVFAHNGKGFETLHTIADVMKIMSTALFILFVLMIAKGWPISKSEIFSKTMLLIILSAYTLIKILLYIWIKDSLNVIEEVDEYHTLPGWISMGFRIILMFWFLHELRHTMILEQDPRKLRFYLHFGAGMLVWFVHLPLVAMVAMQIDMMWRYKIISGFSFAADVFAYGIITKLMMQRKQNYFLAHDPDMDFNDELEYYDEHAINNSETYKFSQANYRAKHTYDNHISCDINSSIKT